MSTRPHCGSDPRTQLTDGDRQAMADFREYLRERPIQAEDPLVSAEEIEARLDAAKAEVARRWAERAALAAEFGLRPDQITLRGCDRRGEEWT